MPEGHQNPSSVIDGKELSRLYLESLKSGFKPEFEDGLAILDKILTGLSNANADKALTYLCALRNKKPYFIAPVTGRNNQSTPETRRVRQPSGPTAPKVRKSAELLAKEAEIAKLNKEIVLKTKTLGVERLDSSDPLLEARSRCFREREAFKNTLAFWQGPTDPPESI